MLYKNRILICLLVFFTLLLMYIIPNDKDNSLIISTELEYIDDVKVSNIYMLDKNNYLGCTNIIIDSDDIEDKAKELIESLIIDSKKQNLIPSGFKPLIPSNTKINNINFKDGVLKIDFNEHLLEVKEELEEKVIESIVYTLTSIKEIKHIIIYIEGNILTKLPQSKITLPTTLDRSFGINKNYNITSSKDITKTTIYYISKFSNNEYYVPVTKINNDTRDKIEIIIDELSNNYNSNLMSYLNNNTKILNMSNESDTIIVNFNDAIYSDINEKEILDEVIYTISMSIIDNYDVNKVIFNVNDEEIYKNY